MRIRRSMYAKIYKKYFEKKWKFSEKEDQEKFMLR